MACASTKASVTWNMSSLRSALPSIHAPSSACSVHFSTGPSSPRFKLSRPKPSSRFLNSFVGLAPIHLLLSLSLSSPGLGRVPKLNRPPDQRRALLRGLTAQLLKHGRIKTTRTRASAMRKYADKMVTLAKDGSLHKKRQALGFIYEKEIVHALFAEVDERYGD